MKDKAIAGELTAVIAEEIAAQVGVRRSAESMAPLIADAVLDAFEVRVVEGTGSTLPSDLAASIRLGYEAEASDPNIGFEMPPDEEIAWLGAWLVSEGWTRDPNWLDQERTR